MTLQIPPLPPVQPPWGEFQVYWQQNIGAIVEAVNAVADAQAAADAANLAAAAADAAASSAQTAADDVTSAQELGSSYVSGAVITATDAGADVTITISAHTRKYPQPDGSTVDVAVNGDTLLALSYSTKYYIYYDDPSRSGGAVSYQSTIVSNTAAQLGDRHLVGAVTTPAAADPPTGGVYTNPPGIGSLDAD